MTGNVPNPPNGPSGGGLPVSVWVCAQHTARAQRHGRYTPDSTAHPAKMFPAIARTAIAHYTHPGDLVLDPMCGIGTTLVEATYLGRHAIGVEYEPRWADIARANLRLAQAQDATGWARVVTGDARRATRLLQPGLRDQVALVLTSPPYGDSLHGQIRSTRETGQPGIHKWHNRYSRDPANLAHQDLHRLLAGFTDILAGCVPLLRPGGIVAITARPFRRGGQLIDFPTAVLDAAQAAGLRPLERLVALLVGIRGKQLVSRASFFQLDAVRKARAHGQPWHVAAHEDVLVVYKPHPTTAATPAAADQAVQAAALPATPAHQTQTRRAA